MDPRSKEISETRFLAYLKGLASVIGHADRKAPLRDYGVGLIACAGRKSVEPMAAVTAPERTAAQHQFGLNALLNAIAPRSGAVSNETANALLAVVDGVRPKDEIEATRRGEAIAALAAIGIDQPRTCG